MSGSDATGGAKAFKGTDKSKASQGTSNEPPVEASDPLPETLISECSPGTP